MPTKKLNEEGEGTTSMDVDTYPQFMTSAGQAGDDVNLPMKQADVLFLSKYKKLPKKLKEKVMKMKKDHPKKKIIGEYGNDVRIMLDKFIDSVDSSSEAN